MAAVLSDEPSAASPPRRFDTALRILARWIGPLLLATLYLSLSLYFLNDHRHQINPDGVGYLSVAQKYAAGHWGDAVNAYWSPLYSWLLAPLVLVRIEPLLASKIGGLLIGAATLAAMDRLGRFAGFPRLVRWLTCAAAMPMVVNAAYAVITPDLLVTGAILFYLAELCNPIEPMRWRAGVRVGLLMGVAYLAKAYAMPFVLAHFAVVRLIEFIRGGEPGERKQTLITAVISLLAMAVIVGLWSAALTHKYGYFLTGSTGRYNLMIDAPNSPGQVMHFAGLLPPPNESATSAWEDITYQMNLLPRWDPREKANRDFLASEISRNWNGVQTELEWLTPWCWPILLVAVLMALSRGELLPRRPGVILLAAIVLYPCGYLLLHIERRFMTPLGVLMLLAIAYAISRAAARKLWPGWWRPALAIGIIGWTFVGHPIDALVASRGSGSDLATMAADLQGVLPPRASVASNSNWSESLYLAFDLNLRYFGTPRPGESPKDVMANLDRFQVDYFLVWKTRHGWPARNGWIEIDPNDHRSFRIYQRPAPASQPTTRTGA